MEERCAKIVIKKQTHTVIKKLTNKKVEQQLTQSQWLELPVTVRDKLRKIFKINRSSPTQAILGTFGKVQSDGSNDRDISVMTVKAMQEYLGNYQTEDFFALFTQVLTRIDSEEKKPLQPVDEPVIENPIYQQWRSQLLMMREESEKVDLVLKLKHMVWEIFPQPLKHEESIQKTTNKRAKKGK